MFVRVCGLAWLLAFAPPAADGGVEPKAEAAAKPKSAANSELAALAQELERGVEELRLPDAPEPYAATLRMARNEILTLDGSYGGLIADLHERHAYASVAVRVGDPTRDNGGFFGVDVAPGFVLPVAPDAATSRYKLWLAMDAGFRAATSAFSSKQAAIARRADDDMPPDRAPAEKLEVSVQWNERATSLDDPRIEALELDRPALRKLVRELSARFSAHPDIDNGDVFVVVLRSYMANVDTEGARVGERRDRALLAVVADTQAADGMQLDHGRAMHLSLQDLADPETAKRAGEMVERTLVELEELAVAPMLDEDYDGPILLLPEAASQLLATTVAPHATGEPAPLSDYGVIDELEPHWLDRLGKSVMPDWVDLIDDPTKPEGFGSYAVDAEGVPAERIQLVRGGILANLLMSRRPNETISASNGRLRATPALQTGPSISNLELVAKRRGLATKELERDLLRRAREDGYDFAYVIEAMRAHDVLGTVVRDSAMDYGAGRKVSMPIPGRVWRVDAKGQRTLVRGALLSPTSMRVLRRIRSVGRDDTTFPMRLTPGISGGFMAETGAEAMIGQTVDVSIRTPSLVVDGLELIVERGDNARLPILVHPLRRGAEAETKDAAGDAAASE